MQKPPTVLDAPINQTRTLPDGTKVRRTNLIGTDFALYTAYVPSAYCGDHSNVTSIDGAPYGAVGSERLPAVLDALPICTPERSAAVQAWQQERYQAGHELIRAAFPEATEGRCTFWELESYQPGIGAQASYENRLALHPKVAARRHAAVAS